jgi:hypothetical protein
MAHVTMELSRFYDTTLQYVGTRVELLSTGFEI